MAIFQPHNDEERRTDAGLPGSAPRCATGRCRLHGGLSTGPKTGEGLERIRRAVTKHGRYSRQAKAEQRQFWELLRHFQTFLNDL
jgi:hypothetical protein